MKLQITPTFSDSICDLRTRKIKATFFSQIKTVARYMTKTKTQT
ncbi:hypothetical protein [Flavicella sp.]